MRVQVSDYLPQELIEYSRQRMPRDERKDVVYSILAGCPWALPLRIIAKQMGMKKSKYLWDIMRELEAEGSITSDIAVTYNGNEVFMFSAVVSDEG